MNHLLFEWKETQKNYEDFVRQRRLKREVEERRYYEGLKPATEKKMFEEDIQYAKKAYEDAIKKYEDEIEDKIPYMICYMEKFIENFKRLTETKHKLEELNYKLEMQKKGKKDE